MLLLIHFDQNSTHPNRISQKDPLPTSEVVITPEPCSYKLDLAKEAFLNRGFTYVKSEQNLHHWRASGRAGNAADVVLLERDTAVWIRASASGLGLPTEDTLITEDHWRVPSF